MNHPPGEEGSQRTDGFAATRWSLVRRALVGGEALNTWLGLYWFPLYTWARRQGTTPEEASDHVQEFLRRLCGKRLLEQANPRRGRLRSWLVKAFSNHLRASHRKSRRLRRGGGAAHLGIDARLAESLYLADGRAHSLSPDQAFDRAFAMALMDEAMAALAAHYGQSGRKELFDEIVAALESPLPEGTYAAAAERLGMNPAALRQAVARMRQRYRRLLLETAAKRLGIGDELRLEAELRELLGG